jgi:hypothetical protein
LESSIKSYIENLSATLKSDRQRARAALEKHVGKITLTVKDEGLSFAKTQS